MWNEDLLLFGKTLYDEYENWVVAVKDRSKGSKRGHSTFTK